MQYDWEALKVKVEASLKEHGISPTVTVTREDMVGIPLPMIGCSRGIYPVLSDFQALSSDFHVLSIHKAKACADSFLESGVQNVFKDKEE